MTITRLTRFWNTLTLARVERVTQLVLGRAVLAAAILAGFATATHGLSTAAVSSATDGPLAPVTIWAAGHGVLPLWAGLVVGLAALMMVGVAARAKVGTRTVKALRGEKVSGLPASLKQLHEGM